MWSPSAELLEFIQNLIESASEYKQGQPHQIEVMQQLRKLSEMPDFVCYLCAILMNLQNNVSIRATAALVLKNEIKLNHAMIGKEPLHFLTLNVLQTLSDPDAFIRRTSCSAIVALFTLLGGTGWPELIAAAGEMLASAEVSRLLTALYLLRLIFEDASLDYNTNTLSLFDALVPLLFNCLSHSTLTVKNESLQCLNQLIFLKPPALTQNLVLFMQILSERIATEKSDSASQKLICTCLTSLVESYCTELTDQLNSIMDFMLRMLQSENEEVALEACEFWLSIPESECHLERITSHLPCLLPVLLKVMQYREGDPALLYNEDLQHESVYPMHHKESKSRSNTAEDSDADEDADDELDEDKYVWNLRKCASATLDLLANLMDQFSFIPILLPRIQVMLNSSDWKELEVGILAVGAISEGCYDSMVPHLDALIPFISSHLNHSVPLIRSICCWSLGRYSTWICSNSEHLVKIWILLLQRMSSDENKKVQCSSTSAVGALIGKLEDDTSQLEQIASLSHQTFLYCLDRFTPKARIILYGVLSHYCELLGPSGMAAFASFSQAMAQLFVNVWLGNGKFEVKEEEGNEIFPFLESLSTIILQLPTDLLHSVSMQLCDRSFSLCSHILHPTNHNDSQLDPDLAVVCIDLVDSLLQVLQSDFLSYLQNGDYISLLFDSLNSVHIPLRQSAFGLFGDLIQCPILLRSILFPHIAFYEQLTLINLEPNTAVANTTGVANNATWALGELYLICYEQNINLTAVLTQTESVLFHLTSTLNRQLGRIQKSLLQNICITIGRLALVQKEAVASRLSSILPSWIRYVADIEDMRELESCMLGMLHAVRINTVELIKVKEPMLKLVHKMKMQNSVSEVAMKISHEFVQILERN